MRILVISVTEAGEHPLMEVNDTFVWMSAELFSSGVDVDSLVSLMSGDSYRIRETQEWLTTPDRKGI